VGILKKLFGGEPSEQADHAVLVCLKLSNAEFGDADERQAIHALSDRLESAIRRANAGELGGDEFGDGTCTLYMYGPDADKLFAAVEPALRGSRLTRGGHVIKRYGAATNPAAREARIDFDEAAN
jgi:hypothetical protein